MHSLDWLRTKRESLRRLTAELFHKIDQEIKKVEISCSTQHLTFLLEILEDKSAKLAELNEKIERLLEDESDIYLETGETEKWDEDIIRYKNYIKVAFKKIECGNSTNNRSAFRRQSFVTERNTTKMKQEEKRDIKCENADDEDIIIVLNENLESGKNQAPDSSSFRSSRIKSEKTNDISINIRHKDHGVKEGKDSAFVAEIIDLDDDDDDVDCSQYTLPERNNAFLTHQEKSRGILIDNVSSLSDLQKEHTNVMAPSTSQWSQNGSSGINLDFNQFVSDAPAPQCKKNKGVSYYKTEKVKEVNTSEIASNISLRSSETYAESNTSLSSSLPEIYDFENNSDLDSVRMDEALSNKPNNAFEILKDESRNTNMEVKNAAKKMGSESAESVNVQIETCKLTETKSAEKQLLSSDTQVSENATPKKRNDESKEIFQPKSGTTSSVLATPPSISQFHSVKKPERSADTSQIQKVFLDTSVPVNYALPLLHGWVREVVYKKPNSTQRFDIYYYLSSEQKKVRFKSCLGVAKYLEENNITDVKRDDFNFKHGPISKTPWEILHWPIDQRRKAVSGNSTISVATKRRANKKRRRNIEDKPKKANKRARGSRNQEDRKCHYCHLTFNVMVDYAKHTRQVHGDSKAFKCSGCTFSTQWINGLKQHQIKHTGFTCPASGCHKKFFSGYTLGEHSKIHTTEMSHVSSDSEFNNLCFASLSANS